MNNNTKIIVLGIVLMISIILIGSEINKQLTKSVIKSVIDQTTLPATISLNMSNGTQIVCNVNGTDVECKNLMADLFIKPVPVNTTAFNEWCNERSSVFLMTRGCRVDDFVGNSDLFVRDPNTIPQYPSPEDIGKMVDTISTPIVINTEPVSKPVDDCDRHPGICGLEGPIGCSGDPNPPSTNDIKQFQAGNFTSRQDDIMIGTCYSSKLNNDITISDNDTKNGLKIDYGCGERSPILAEEDRRIECENQHYNITGKNKTTFFGVETYCCPSPWIPDDLLGRIN